MRNKLIFSLIILAVLVGAFGVWRWQRNIYSKDVLKLEILGQEEAELGQEIEYIVKFKNNGNICLEEPNLIFEYPNHTLSSLDQPSRETLNSEELGGDIYPGQEKTFSFKTQLLGREGEPLEAKAELSYRPKNLKPRYQSSTAFITIIKKVPLSFEFDFPSKVESGEKIEFSLNYSILDFSLSDLGIKIEYPAGFKFYSSSPEALGQTEWEIPSLDKAEGGRISITGIIGDGAGENKVFKAKIGKWQEGEFILLKETEKVLKIAKPSLYISQKINNNPRYIADDGQELHYEVSFRNIGQEVLENLCLKIWLAGELFAFNSLKAPQAEFQSENNSIVWKGEEISKLKFLEPEEQGKIEFWINLKQDWELPGPAYKNLAVKSKVYLGQAQEEFITKINSKLGLEQKGYFEEEFFGNSGPLPPKVGKTTTYTILWQIRNYYNDLKNIKVKATLPQGVSFTGKLFPESSGLTFDSASREIVWQIESLQAGQGILALPKTCAFQLAFTPVEQQKGKSALLISEAKISGEDEWTEKILTAEASAVNTTLPNDGTVSEDRGIIQ